MDGLAERIITVLDDIQSSMYNRALKLRESMTHHVNTWEEFEKALDAGGFVYAHWDGTSETEKKIKDRTKATIRCIPLDSVAEDGKCILTGAPSSRRVLFAIAY
jgi:prolyl-tRNA synthetase